MNRLTDNKIVLVTRPTRLAELVARFNTVSQARFYIEHLGADFQDYLDEDETYHHALVEAQRILSRLGRVQTVDRSFLPNFVFGPEDTVVTLGQDGLVANTLKYLAGQPVVGVNPDPLRWDGKLLPFKVGDLPKLLPEVFARDRPTKLVTMAKASLNNGQTMYAVNDLFIGPKSHTSARYVIRSGESMEAQSSSGVIVSTGLGSSGWFKSLLTGATALTRSAAPIMTGTFRPARHASRTGTHRAASVMSKPAGALSVPPGTNGASTGIAIDFPWDAEHLFFTVREPFPTRNTGVSLVFGQVTSETPLFVESQMAENGVIFSDGIEKDFLEFNSGAQAVIGLAERRGVLVT